MQRGRWLIAAALIVSTAACGSEPKPDAVPFERVDLPAGAVPAVLGKSGGDLLVGISRPSGDTVPGLLRVTSDGRVSEVALTPSTPYGRVARWSSVTGDGTRVLAVGGERGGAHGNVRWSVWTGPYDAVVERKQGFSTFGGYGAGDLTGGVLTPSGPVVVGAWESARAAMDVAVWTIDDAHVATRHPSAGTALESSREEIAFPISATAYGAGVLIAGWQIESGKQVPVMWHSASGTGDWTKTALPDAGQTATADAVHCAEAECAVVGRVDGHVAVWRLAGGTWSRITGMPAVPVGDRDRVVAPAPTPGGWTVAVADAGRTRLLRWREGGWTAQDVSGPEGPPVALSTLGDTVFVISGTDDNTALWRSAAR